MAITELRPIKAGKKSEAAAVKDRLRYYMNPEKTDGGRLVSAYQCLAETAADEFMAVKRLYAAQTGRARKGRSNAVLWRIMQSFKPGETTPEEAHRIGCELALRFTKGRYQFVVSTHVDKQHLHNHICWNSTSLDGLHKWNDFYRSASAVRSLSDELCKGHGLTLVTPKNKGRDYIEWTEEKKGRSWKEKLRRTIDAVLPVSPDFQSFLMRMRQAGYQVKTGKYIAFRAVGQTRFTRAKTLGENYTGQAIRERLRRGRGLERTQKKARIQYAQGVNLLIDIRAKIRAGKGPGYEHWAKIFNVKQTAKTLNYLTEHGIVDYGALLKLEKETAEHCTSAAAALRRCEGRMARISGLESQITAYGKTRAVYQRYKQTGWSPAFLAEHEEEIRVHRAAKRAFDALPAGKLPKMAELKQQYAALLRMKRAQAGAYARLKKQRRELRTVRRNVEKILEITVQEREKEM